MVEHNLAKVGVASSSLVSRSIIVVSDSRVIKFTVFTKLIVSHSSRGLGHRPFTAVTGVRTPYGTPLFRLALLAKITKKTLE